MLIVISLMIIGMLAGYLLRNHRLACMPRVINVLIWALLFLLGVEVGSNRRIVQGLWTLGIEAVVISVLCTLGSCVAAWILWRVISRGESAKSSNRGAGEGLQS